VRDQVSHPYQTAGKIIVLVLLLLLLCLIINVARETALI
jgi:hypothetical protein